jgi:soluble lytic murein transglycosylase-like protein
MEMPPQVEGLHNEHIVIECVAKASALFDINPLLLMAVRQQEAGKVGQYSSNTNKTHDVGPMQINVNVWLDTMEREFNVTLEELLYDACTNVYMGAWILDNEIDSLKEGESIWSAVGNYHSRTPKFHNRYKEKVKERYDRLLNRLK